MPDSRDGLKPVHRRILNVAKEKALWPKGSYTKNADIVGTVMGKYHPHGDGSIYGALVYMAQTWNTRYPLIDVHGNKGNIDGDGPAAMRYTEGKLHKNSLPLLEDTEEGIVEYKPNYMENTFEPVVLPSKFPNLLVNGSYGIAVGYTTNIPSHQLGEVIDCIISVIKEPNSTTDDLMKYIKGPDMPTGAYLINNSSIKELYETGKASLTFKAKYIIENNSESGNPQLVITEIPPGVKKPSLVEKIHNLCIEKKSIPRVLDVRDESESGGIRIVVELQKTGIPDLVIKELFSQTQLKCNTTFIMRALVNQIPKVLSLREMIDIYIQHRQECIERRTKKLLNEANNKLTIQNGFMTVLKDIKKAISIIENSENDKECKENLMKEFSLNLDQVEAILDMKLRQLNRLNRNDLIDLISSLKEKIEEYNLLLSNNKEINDMIIKELKELKLKYNDERLTEIINEDEETELISEEVSNEPISLILTSKNNIKHMTVKALEDMIKNKALRERTDVFIQGLKCTMNDTFILILNTGEYIKVHFNDILSEKLDFIPKDSFIKAIVLFKDTEEKAIIAITKKGIIKKIKMNKFKAKVKKPTMLFDITDDELLSIKVSDLSEDNIITIASKDGIIHRFFEKSFKDTSVGGKGLPSISLDENNEVVDFTITNQNEDNNSKFILFTKHDEEFGIKAMNLEEFKPKGRISKGIKGVDFSKKNPGELYKIVIAKDDFFIVDNKGLLINYKLDKLEISNRYGKPEIISNNILINDFFLE